MSIPGTEPIELLPLANVTSGSNVTTQTIIVPDFSLVDLDLPPPSRHQDRAPTEIRAADFAEVASEKLQPKLTERHLSMLGIAGSIGTGLFLGLGQSIQLGGPLGALLGYATVSLVVASVQLALGETSAFSPITGSFVQHSESLLDPAWGFAIGWNLVYGNLLSIPSEITAICVLFQLWTDTNSTVWIVTFIVLTALIGLSPINIFGELECWLGLLKILLVVFLVIFGLVISLGGIHGVEPIAFRYWKNPGPFVEQVATGNWGQFLGYWSVMTSAVFSFAGVESIAMAGAETRSPRTSIPKACRNVFWRIILFYILAVLVVGMLVASDDKKLNDLSGTAAQSPFVIAANKAGYTAVGSVVNAIVITSAWSSSNQSLLAGSRTLYALSKTGRAPRVFSRETSWGIPHYTIGLFCSFMLLAFLSFSTNALSAFYWLISLTASGVLMSWITILLNHIRLLGACKVQNIQIAELPWHKPWTLYTSYFGLVMCVTILMTGGFSVFTENNWNTSRFISAYIDIPLVLVAYFIWKIYKKTSVVNLSEVNLKTNLSEIAAENRLQQARRASTSHNAEQGLS